MTDKKVHQLWVAVTDEHHVHRLFRVVSNSPVYLQEWARADGSDTYHELPVNPDFRLPVTRDVHDDEQAAQRITKEDT